MRLAPRRIAPFNMKALALNHLPRRLFAVFALLACSLSAATFTVESMAPATGSKTIGQNEPIAVTFGKALAADWASAIALYRNGAPGLYAGVNPLPVPGGWSLTDPKTLTFTPSSPYPKGSLLMVKIAPSLAATDGSKFAAAQGSWSFLVTPGPTRYTATEKEFVVQTVMQNSVKHELPVRIVNPTTPGPHPVMFWIHGGSWKGSTATASGAGEALQVDYLSEILGIACVSVSYRCLGAKGTFTQSLSDVNFAVSYIRDHAAAYNIDPKRMGLYGGSAGTPLAALVAQQQPGVICYVGFNGVYDFTRNPGSNFPTDDRYEWKKPTPETNSAFYHLASPPPNTILLHGSVDTIINPQQSVLFGEKIVNSGGKARVLIYNGEKHGFFNVDREMALPTLYEMKEHLKSVFGL